MKKILWSGVTLLVSAGMAVASLAANEADGRFAETVLSDWENDRLSIAGEWSVTLPDDPALYPVQLPGSLDEAGVGTPLEKPERGALSRHVRYIGPAVYRREINIPENLAGRELELFLERVLWQSQVKIDGRLLPEPRQSLATPHIHRLGKLAAGRHTLELIIDNSMIYRLGNHAHAYGESMQTIWNGAVGTLEIRPADPIAELRIDAAFPAEALDIRFRGPAGRYLVQLTPRNFAGEAYQAILASVAAEDGRQLLHLPFPDTKPQAWSEFAPCLYDLTAVRLDRDGAPAVIAEEVGFRTVRREGNRLFLNDRPLFLRGNLDNCHFPLTGYPAMDKASWLRLMRISRENGINNIRFHSWCPPRAAFEAADEVGVYLEPEVNLWIDGWMGDENGRPLTGIGREDRDLNRFIRQELHDIIAVYGNLPSLTMLEFGNELGSADFDVLGQWLNEIKQQDRRRLYSASTARSISGADDYLVTHDYPDVGGTRGRMSAGTAWNYEDIYGRTQLPTIAHEIGQWPVYPDYREIDLYTGVLHSTALETSRRQAEEAGVLRFNREYAFASGMQSKMMYKDEIEAFLRTPSCAGLQLLGMQDYSGQGEALIGWLDSFYRNKGVLPPEEVRSFLAPTAVYAEFAKYVWTATETPEIGLVIHHYGENDLRDGRIAVTLRSADGSTVREELMTIGGIPVGTVKKAGAVRLPLNDLTSGRYELTAEVLDGERPVSGPNCWPLWVLPQEITVACPANVVFTDKSEEALRALASGQNVVLDAHALGVRPDYLPADWGSVYWSTSWFSGQARRTLGLWLEEDSPVFMHFGAQGFGDWIWFRLAENGRAFKLTGLPADYCPIAMPVPDFHFNQLLGTIFAVKVGEGKLLVSGYDLSREWPETRQLKANLLAWAGASGFEPAAEVSADWVRQLFRTLDTAALPRPEEFRQAAVYLEPAARLTEMGRDVNWEAKFDRADLADDCSYEVRNVSLWADSDGQYWVLQPNSLITLKFPSGETGRLLVRFRDPNRNNRSGEGVFEGRPFSVPVHQDNPAGVYWLELRVDREDSLDGELNFQVTPQSGPNLMIDRFIYLPNR